MRLKHDGTFFLTSTWQRHATLLKKSERWWEKRQLLTVEFLRNSSADCFTTTDRTQLKTHSPEGPTNGQRRFNQEEERDGGENCDAIPKMRILSTLSVDTGSRGATNTASQSWKSAFPHSFGNHDSGLDMTCLPSPIHQKLGVYWSYQVRLLHTIFVNLTFLILTDQQSIPRLLKNMTVTERR